MRLSLRKRLAVIGVAATTLTALSAAPAQAAKSGGDNWSYGSKILLWDFYQVDYSNDTPSNPNELKLKIDDEISMGYQASSAQMCTMTGWATLANTTGDTWTSPHVVTGCDEALVATKGNSAAVRTTFYSSDTSASVWQAHVCFTLTWEPSGTHITECYNGEWYGLGTVS